MFSRQKTSGAAKEVLELEFDPRCMSPSYSAGLDWGSLGLFTGEHSGRKVEIRISQVDTLALLNVDKVQFFGDSLVMQVGQSLGLLRNYLVRGKNGVYCVM